MSVFREEVARELEDQRQSNEHHIAYYMDPNVRVVNPLNKYRQSVHHPYNYGAGYGYAGYPNNWNSGFRRSLSPVRFRNEFGLDSKR